MNVASDNHCSRLINVSTRLPWTLKKTVKGWCTERSVGGLTAALDPLFKQITAHIPALWIGWSGDTSGQADQPLLARWAKRYGIITVDLSAEIVQGFYEGYANQTLWPLFHDCPSFVHFHPDHWRAYQAANQRFCDVLLAHLRPNDTVWIHDYQLMLLPALLRGHVPDVRIGFFLHIPFPAPLVFQTLPHKENILQGLLGADHIAFHTDVYLQHFRTSCLQILGKESRHDRIDLGDFGGRSGRSITLDASPIGTAPNEWRALLDKTGTAARLAQLRAKFAGQKILLAVDRLDYTKGIPERLRTFRRLLHDVPHWQGRVSLIQVSVPSREAIPMYRELGHEVDQLVDDINGEFSGRDWTPITFRRRSIPRTELAALYALADVAWVAPLCDGLNLVAKEYVACQRKGDGILVLSKFAGSAAEMREAFLINPHDEEGTAKIIARALSLPINERRERMAALIERVNKHTVFSWGARFLSKLQSVVVPREQHCPSPPKRLPIADILEAFQGGPSIQGRTHRRLLLLDYDGTLTPFAMQPNAAIPSPTLINDLSRLAAHPSNTIALVSGRSRADLEKWFGDIPHLWLAAEHGAMMRSPTSKEWELYGPHDLDDGSDAWKQQVLPILEHFVDRAPGSFIEEKEFTLTWHYRMSDPQSGRGLASELVAHLEERLAETRLNTVLRVMQGQKVVEVKRMWANKGNIFAQLATASPEAHFHLAAGDDVTDEDLFASLTANDWTIHVGNGPSRARFYVSGPEEMARLLTQFADRL